MGILLRYKPPPKNGQRSGVTTGDGFTHSSSFRTTSARIEAPPRYFRRVCGATSTAKATWPIPCFATADVTDFSDWIGFKHTERRQSVNSNRLREWSRLRRGTHKKRHPPHFVRGNVSERWCVLPATSIFPSVRSTPLMKSVNHERISRFHASIGPSNVASRTPA